MAVVLLALCLVFPFTRFLLVNNILPLSLLAVLVIGFCRMVPLRISAGIGVGAIMALAVIIQVHDILRTGAIVEVDSQGYIYWAHEFAAGHGFPGMIFRSPLYPFVLGVTFLGGHSSLLPIVIFQHALLVLCVPGIYLAAILSGCSKQGSLFASLLISVNSLIVQSASRIMTETLYLSLLLSVFILVLVWIKQPSIFRSILCGGVFSLIALLRPGVELLLAIALLVLILRWKKSAMVPCLIVVAIFAALTAPWSFRNCARFQTYSLSRSTGIHLFTKAETYNLLDTAGRRYAEIKAPLAGVLHDLRVTDNSWKKPREDAWEINAIPHALKDSLMRYHGYSYTLADNALARAALEGIAKRPVPYTGSVLKTLSVFFFQHHEMYPATNAIVPGKVLCWFSIVPQSMLRGFFYVPGILFVLSPLLLLLKRKPVYVRFFPFLFGMAGMTVVAFVEVGLTRYTIPWIPYWIVCIAAVMPDIRPTAEKGHDHGG
jgi:hypothetical protein